MNKVILKGFIILPTTDFEAVELALITQTKLTLQELGCLIFSVTVDEVFINQQAFDHHQARVKTSKW